MYCEDRVNFHEEFTAALYRQSTSKWEWMKCHYKCFHLLMCAKEKHDFITVVVAIRTNNLKNSQLS